MVCKLLTQNRKYIRFLFYFLQTSTKKVLKRCQISKNVDVWDLTKSPYMSIIRLQSKLNAPFNIGGFTNENIK